MDNFQMNRRQALIVGGLGTLSMGMPGAFAATTYHALGVPLNAPQNNSGISRPITTGKPIMELFG